MKLIPWVKPGGSNDRRFRIGRTNCRGNESAAKEYKPLFQAKLFGIAFSFHDQGPFWHYIGMFNISVPEYALFLSYIKSNFFSKIAINYASQ